MVKIYTPHIWLSSLKVYNSACEVVPFPDRRVPPDGDLLWLAGPCIELMLAFARLMAPVTFLPWPDSRETTVANASRENPDATDCN